MKYSLHEIHARNLETIRRAVERTDQRRRAAELGLPVRSRPLAFHLRRLLRPWL